MDRLTAWANTRNGRSQVALERVGFKREGVLRSFHRHGDVLHDVVVFGMVRNGWMHSRLHGVHGAHRGDVAAGIHRRMTPTIPQVAGWNNRQIRGWGAFRTSRAQEPAATDRCPAPTT